MSEKLSENQLKFKIKQLFKPILIIFNISKAEIHITDEDKLVVVIGDELQWDAVDMEQLPPNEMQLLKRKETGIEAQKTYAAAKLTTNDSLTRGYFFISKSDDSEFSEKDFTLLNSFLQLINETIDDYEEQDKLTDVFNDFVHKSVHDLKNPLTSILLTTELLKRKNDDPTIVMKFADKLENASKRLFENLDHLKAAFPTDDRSFKLAINEVDLKKLLSEVTANQNTALVFNAEKTVIYADANRLKQAFGNLISIIPQHLEQSIMVETAADEIKISLKHHGLHHHKQTKFLIARTLIEMHKGKITDGEDTYYISLPLATP
ncbi:sensor histidine kinase [Nubsella zeaxanthinifaciens]|jgi:signal transduction histidine kinase|uniref:sensor histidine kinase n=1 Tax=Nubsella zeaxanthinifaciens TaxID=392412 RepID=UPI000DE39781|nr:histidine kinase dimerization/phospho-acceptor domain-containing protein [Nubsella zeaxanthinifaciens]